MEPPFARSQAFDTTCTAWLGRWIDTVPLGLHVSHRSAVSDVRVGLPNFYNVAIRIADVAARLAVFGLWLRDELGSLAFPEFIARLNIGNADIHEAADQIGVGGDAERCRWLVGCRTAPDIDDEPHVS